MRSRCMTTTQPTLFDDPQTERAPVLVAGTPQHDEWLQAVWAVHGVGQCCEWPQQSTLKGHYEQRNNTRTVSATA